MDKMFDIHTNPVFWIAIIVLSHATFTTAQTMNSTRGTPEYWTEETPFFSRIELGFNRPFSLSTSVPINQRNTLQYKWAQYFKGPQAARCYCTLAYRLIYPIGGCALITHRHALSTATPLAHFFESNDIGTFYPGLIGVSYDRSGEGNNTSEVGITRIHFHPEFSLKVNFTHPIPMNDIAVLTLLHPVVTTPGERFTNADICYRVQNPVITYNRDLYFWIIGSRFIAPYGRKPNAQMKYVVRTRDIIKCPQQGWDMYYCIQDRTQWAPYGLDSGAPLHQTHKTDFGLLGLAAFSTDLMRGQMVHYFTSIISHSMLEFMYDAYMGILPYTWKDIQFYDTAMRAPVGNPYNTVPWLGVQDICSQYTENYRIKCR